MSDQEKKSVEFEAALEELETLVTRMEEGDLPLEEALKRFEKGIRLTRDCQRALREAEQKVERLMESFVLELGKLDEALEVLAAYVRRMRTQSARHQDPSRTLH